MADTLILESKIATLPSRHTSQPDVVVTRTPLRISFAGGGTDLPCYYEKDYGAVFSAAINKYVYVTVKRHSRIFDEPIRLNYSKAERVSHVSDIENGIIREALRLLNVDPPIYISSVADLPASSGVGGSASFAVGLLQGLHAFQGERVSPGQLAEEAAHLEINCLGRPVGKQDQYAAAFGGVNYFRFDSDGVSVEPCGSHSQMKRLFSNLLLFWTGVQRDAASVLTEQSRNTPERMAELDAMRHQASELRALARRGALDVASLGRVLHEGWQMKRRLAGNITSPQIDALYREALDAGAEGGKLCGAGGGGFLLFAVHPQFHRAVREVLRGTTHVDYGPEAQGSRILLTSGE